MCDFRILPVASLCDLRYNSPYTEALLMEDEMAEHGKHDADIEHVSHLNGMHVGLLDESEVAAFDRLCEAGIAYRAYEGGSGFMGLAKVRFRREIARA